MSTVASSRLNIIEGSYFGWFGSTLALDGRDTGLGRSGFTTMTAGALSSGNWDNKASTSFSREDRGRDLEQGQHAS